MINIKKQHIIPLERSKKRVRQIKEKVLVLTVFMLGMFNTVYDEEDSINGNKLYTEQPVVIYENRIYKIKEVKVK